MKDFDHLAGELVRSARISRSWTQARLATKVGITRKTVNRVELGRKARSDTLIRMSAILSLDLYDLDEEEASSRRLEGVNYALRSLRQTRGLTLEKCAEAAGVSVATLSRFERDLNFPAELAQINETGGSQITNAGLACALGCEGVDELNSLLRNSDDCVARELDRAAGVFDQG